MTTTSPAIGIDFGTTKCVAAIVDGQTPRPILDRHGRAHIPSLVLVSPDGELSVGWEAQNHRRRYETEYITINSIKRSVGKQGESGWAWWKTRPQEVAALILGRLKMEVEASLCHAVEDAVIAIPGHFSINQRWAVKQAAEIAGFNVLGLLNEATAAGLRYGLRSSERREQKLLVFDFGGGTLDVSVLEIAEGVYEVKATAGDDQLGGDDFDQVIFDLIRDQLNTTASTAVELTTGRRTVLREAAVQAKIDLSSSAQARIHLPGFLSASRGARHDIDIRITADHFRSLCSPLVNRVLPVLERVLADAGLKPSDAGTVLLTGGASRMPEVQRLVRSFFGSLTFIGAYGDSVVAEGAAIYAAVKSGRVKDTLLLDVCPASLGIETLGGVMTVLIPRNSTIPTKRAEIFSTTDDNQTTVKIHVLQGEHELARSNELLGSLELKGIPPAAAGVAQIEVTFAIDENCVERVTALNRETGRRDVLQLVSPSRLSPVQMSTMKLAVANHLSVVREQQNVERERSRLEDSRANAARVIVVIDRVLAEIPGQFVCAEASLLAEARRLICDYLDRRASPADQGRLIEGIQQEIADILAAAVARTGQALALDGGLADWAAVAARRLPEGSVCTAVADLRSRLAVPVEAMQEALDLSAALGDTPGWSPSRSKVEVCRRAANQLAGEPTARCWLGLMLCLFDQEGLGDPGCWLPTAWTDSPLSWLGLVMLDSLLEQPTPSPIARVEDPVARCLTTLLGALQTKELEFQRLVVCFLDRIVENHLSEGIVPGLLDFTASATDAESIRVAVRVLQKVGRNEAVLPLVRLSFHQDSSIREAAHLALSHFDEQRLTSALDCSSASGVWRDLVRLDPRLLKAWAASPTFLGERSALLINTLPAAEPEVQRLIVQAMAGAWLRDPVHLSPLIRTAETAADPTVRGGTVALIATIDGERVVAPLLRLGRDGDATVRSAARDALDRCGTALGPRIARLIRLAADLSKRPRLRDRFFLWRMTIRNPDLRRTLAFLAARKRQQDGRSRPGVGPTSAGASSLDPHGPAFD